VDGTDRNSAGGNFDFSGIFLSVIPPNATQVGSAVALIYVGIVSLALGVVLLGVGLIRSA
jgi:hypothetical protein